MPRVVVANALDGSLMFFDATTRKHLKTLKVGAAPQGIAVARNGRYGVVANTRDATFSVVDLIRMSETARLEPGGEVREPLGVTVLADGRRVLATSATKGDAYVVDTQTGKAVVEVKLPGPAAPLHAPLSGGERVWLAVPDKGLVVAVDTRTGTVVSQHDIPGVPCGVTPARDQRTLLVIRRDPATVSRLDPATGSVNSAAGVAPGPIAVIAHPQKDAAFVLVAGGVQTVDLATGESAAPIPVGLAPHAFAVARAGKTAYVTSSDANTVTVVDMERRNIRDTWSTGNHPTAIVYVP